MSTFEELHSVQATPSLSPSLSCFLSPWVNYVSVRMGEKQQHCAALWIRSAVSFLMTRLTSCTQPSSLVFEWVRKCMNISMYCKAPWVGNKSRKVLWMQSIHHSWRCLSHKHLSVVHTDTSAVTCQLNALLESFLSYVTNQLKLWKTFAIYSFLWLVHCQGQQLNNCKWLIVP